MDASFGFQAGKFGFNITGGAGQQVAIQSSTNLRDWTTVTTITLGSGPYYFSDPDSSGSFARFYRVLEP